MPNQEIINFANHLADLSAQIAKKYFRLPNGEFNKADDSPVTLADREIEEILRAEIKKNYPSHGIIGEEFGNHNLDAELVWILDPIDGTSSFIIGRPTFGTLIALTKNGKSILGIMNQPITGERWIGVDGDSAWLNKIKIQSRENCLELQDAVLCTTSPFFFKNDDEKILKKLINKTKYQNYGGIIYGGDCYLYALLASGFVDLVIDSGLKSYDYAALIPIIEMAGGVVTNWQGKDLDFKSDSRVLAAGNKILHRKALEIINKD